MHVELLVFLSSSLFAFLHNNESHFLLNNLEFYAGIFQFSYKYLAQFAEVCISSKKIVRWRVKPCISAKKNIGSLNFEIFEFLR